MPTVEMTAVRPPTITTTCCIAGGGPAGMMLGFLLARAGVDVVVAEKHTDFLRDFRGDTIHPSTMELMHELGLLAEFLALPHQQARHLSGVFGETRITVADFTHLKVQCPFIALMPQWDFLNFMAERAARFPRFKLMMGAEVTDLIVRDGQVHGITARTPEGMATIEADLVVGADGRHSVVRERAGLKVVDLGAPMDVFWMRLSRRASDGSEPLGRIAAGRIFIMIDRGDYWQCGLVVPKGSAGEWRERGLDALRAEIARVAPAMRDRAGELKSWDDAKLLSVVIDRLERWHRPGLLCIGDAAHAMSPVAGVGINLAIQDAVAAANILAAPLRAGALGDADLAAVQRRRMLPTRLTQRLQVLIQNIIIRRVLTSRQQLTPPLPLRLLSRWPWLQRLPARLVGLGFRPEHIRTGIHA